jgi:outer membrane immunogenic protein
MSSPLIEARPRAYRLALAVILAATASLARGSTTAAAADMSTKTTEPPSYQWTGCYVGLNAGGGGSGSNFSSSIDPGTHLLGGDPALVGADGTGGADVSSFLGGGQVGCNLQSGTLVYGVEGDVDYFRSNPKFINNTDTLSDGVTPFTVTQSLTTDYLATVRPRFGIAADRNLAYITGGAAFTTVNYLQTYADAATPPGTGIATGSRSLVGWAAGGGWEYAWAEHWTLRVEYLFVSFEKTNGLGSITDAAGGANTLHGSGDLVIQIGRVGVNFKF